MKNNNIIKGFTVIMILLMVSAVNIFAVDSKYNKEKKSTQDYTTIKGKVVDMETGVPLVFAGVSVKGTNIATVTNIDGEFIIKVPPAENTLIEFSFVGYKNKTVPLSDFRLNSQKNTIELETAAIPIKEVVVRPLDPDYIIQQAMDHFYTNYPSVANEMTGFYRETIRKNRTYVSIGEAIVDVFKAPYNNDLRYDAVKIYKGRKNTETQKMDTVLFKLQGGPVTILQLDFVKNPENFLTPESVQKYNFSLSSMIEIDNRSNYVIDFVQRPGVEVPLFVGKLFIDTETYAIAQAEFGVNLNDKEAATTMFVRKKPAGMKVTPENTSYLVRYKQDDGKWYFAYSRAEIKFKTDWKRKFFKTNYTTMSELAITDRTDQDVLKFAAKDKMRLNDFFTEEIAAFTDPDFWGEYNVIEPDQSIESAIRRLSRKLKFENR